MKVYLSGPITGLRPSEATSCAAEIRKRVHHGDPVTGREVGVDGDGAAAILRQVSPDLGYGE